MGTGILITSGDLMTGILLTGSLYYFKQCTITLALNCSGFNIIKTYYSCFSYYNYCFKSCKLCSNSRYCCFTFFFFNLLLSFQDQ